MNSSQKVERNWLNGGRLLTQYVSSDDASGDGATVTSLSIDDEWIIVGMANAKIHAFDVKTGLFVRTLIGHSAGVWCLCLISGYPKLVFKQQNKHVPQTSDFILAHHDSFLSNEIISREIEKSQDVSSLNDDNGRLYGSVKGFGNESTILLSSGCDGDVRVWDLSTGECKYVLTGHQSTVRCLRAFKGKPIAVSGSRDGSMRVWDIEKGHLIHLLEGHERTIRSIDLFDNLIASVSYDCTARIWNVNSGECVHILRGHHHQLYSIAMNKFFIATGSLDSTVKIWNVKTGECISTISEHSSLVGQLQLTDSTLISGGSDGKVNVFSLETMKSLYQLLAHENSVTSLQFDDRVIVTGGNDGKVKLWYFQTGEFVQESCQASEQVWKVSFRDDKCVVLCRRNDKTAMDIICFRPIEETF